VYTKTTFLTEINVALSIYPYFCIHSSLAPKHLHGSRLMQPGVTIQPMFGSTLKSLLVWLGGALIVALAYQKMGWPGVALAVGMLVFWMLLLYTRMMRTLRTAANNPKGAVTSAVMLNARLKTGLSLLQVIAMTKSLGEEVSKEPEVWRWTDASQSLVECTFGTGKLKSWQLTRPAQTEDQPEATA
jgi:hypothetical protein